MKKGSKLLSLIALLLTLAMTLCSCDFAEIGGFLDELFGIMEEIEGELDNQLGGGGNTVNIPSADLDSIPECDGLMERLAVIRAEAEDVADRIREFGDEDVGDPTAELDKLEGRLDTISRLSRKYGEDIPAILAFREQAAARLEEIDTADDRIADCEARLSELTDRMTELAARLTAHRKEAAAGLGEQVQEALSFLDMPKVRFEVAVTPLGTFGGEGADEVEFLTPKGDDQGNSYSAPTAPRPQMNRNQDVAGFTDISSDDIPF